MADWGSIWFPEYHQKQFLISWSGKAMSKPLAWLGRAPKQNKWTKNDMVAEAIVVNFLCLRPVQRFDLHRFDLWNQLTSGTWQEWSHENKARSNYWAPLGVCLPQKRRVWRGGTMKMCLSSIAVNRHWSLIPLLVVPLHKSRSIYWPLPDNKPSSFSCQKE